MRTYPKETAEWLLTWAYRGLEAARALCKIATVEVGNRGNNDGNGDKVTLPYVILEDGIYLSNTFRAVSPPGEGYDWKPAYDTTGEGVPHPLSAPMLPLPFMAAELAVFMLDGVGAQIPMVLECPLGGNIEESPTLPSDPGQQFEREALIEAYALIAEAIEQVGEFDEVDQARALELISQASSARRNALKQEGVFLEGEPGTEYQERRDRVLASVAPQLEEARQALEASKRTWFAWRRAMVQELLGPAVEGEASKTDADKPIPRSEAQERAMLAAIREAGHDPKALSPTAPGKRGVKAEVRQRLEGKNLLFVRGSRVFDKCWQRLRGSEEIIDAS